MRGCEKLHLSKVLLQPSNLWNWPAKEESDPGGVSAVQAFPGPLAVPEPDDWLTSPL